MFKQIKKTLSFVLVQVRVLCGSQTRPDHLGGDGAEGEEEKSPHLPTEVCGARPFGVLTSARAVYQPVSLHPDADDAEMTAGARGCSTAAHGAVWSL